MATEESDVKQEVYRIPPNYEDAGGIMGGKFTKRNGLDMAIVCGPLLFINIKFVFPNCSIQTSIIVFMCTIIPSLALCAFGIGGESLSQMLIAYIRFLKRKRKLSYIQFTDAASASTQKKKFSLDKFFDDIASGGIKKTMQDTISNRSQTKQNDPISSQQPTEEPVPEKAPQKAIPTAPKAHKKHPHAHTNSPRLVGSALREKLIQKLELGDDDDF